jgi:hypothetical protein
MIWFLATFCYIKEINLRYTPQFLWYVYENISILVKQQPSHAYFIFTIHFF